MHQKLRAGLHTWAAHTLGGSKYSVAMLRFKSAVRLVKFSNRLEAETAAAAKAADEDGGGGSMCIASADIATASKHEQEMDAAERKDQKDVEKSMANKHVDGGHDAGDEWVVWCKKIVEHERYVALPV